MTDKKRGQTEDMAGKVWKDGARRGIAYVEDREAAEKVMALAAARGKGKATTATPLPPPPVPQQQQQRRRQAKPASPQEALLVSSGAMAVYCDRKGRPFAYQIPFDLACWEQVAKVVGVEP